MRSTRFRDRLPRRLGLKIATFSLAAGLLGAVGAITPAGANAPNPNADISATGQVNGDGSVTVHLAGTWVWPGQTCEGRYGEGWAVDWWGISTSPTPANNFTLTNVTLIPGPNQRIIGTESAAGSIQLRDHSGYFHVGTMYNDETVNGASTCSDVSIGGKQGSQGTWSATATYPNAGDIPPNICVNGYDEHGSEGKPSKGNDYSPIADGDNSIQTNAFDPTTGAGYCTAPKIAAKLTLTLVKTNDANNDGIFAKSEIAKTAGQSVPFKAVITNTANVSIVVDSLEDQWPSKAAFSLDSACPGIVDSTLPAGGSVTCSFTEANYAPPSGQSLTNTVTVHGHQPGVPTNTVTRTDTSTVTTNTAPPPTGYIEICKQQSGTGLEGMLFTFMMQGKNYTVPVGACSPAIKVNAGQVSITEAARAASQLVSVATIPAPRLSSVDLTTRTAVVTVVPGNVSTQTIVKFTNKLRPGTGYLKICKVAGAGVAVGTKFNFSVGATTVAVPAGPAPGGYCAIAGTFSFGNHTVTEATVAGDHVASIAVGPANRAVSSSLADQQATVAVGSGVTEVTFTNAKDTP